MTNELDSIRREIQNLTRSLESLSERVNQLAEAPEKTVAAQARLDALIPGAAVDRTAPHPAPATTPSAQASDSSTGNLLGVIAVICFVLAGVFLVRLAIQAGWLTPARQWGMTLLLGMALIGAGLKIRSAAADYSGFLPASGIIVLAAAAIGGHRYFEIYGPHGAIIAMSFVSFASLLLYRIFRHDMFIATAAVGAYLLPLMLKSQGSPIEQVGLYYIGWTGTFAIASLWIESRTLPLIAGYLGIGVFAMIADVRYTGIYDVPAIVALVQAGLIVFGVLRYSFKQWEFLGTKEAWSYFPLALFFYGLEYSYVDRLKPGLAPWLGLAFAATMLALHRYVHRKLERKDLPSGNLLVSWAAVMVFHSGYLQLLPADVAPSLLVVGLFAAPLLKSRSRAEMVTSRPILLLLALAVLGIEYGRVLWNLLESSSPGTWIFFGLAVGSGLIFFFLQYARDAWHRSRESMHLLLGAAHFQAILALYRLVEKHGSLAVSGIWTVYAGLILGLALRLKDPVLGRSSMVILLIAAGKALLYDASEATAPVRILCLLLTGALLYGSGLLFRKIASWKLPA